MAWRESHGMKSFRVFLCFLLAVVTMLQAGDLPVEPVSFSKIIPLLPAVPEGWTGAEPDGATSDMGGVKMTTAGCTYTKGTGDEAPTVSFNIIDFVKNKPFCDATIASWGTSSESSAGYMKSVKIGGYPGFESYDRSGKSGQLWVVVAERFFVHLETSNLDPAELQVWLGRFDLKKLGVLK